MTCSDSASAGAPCDTRRPSRQHQHVIGKSRGEPEIVRHHDHQHAFVGGGAQVLHDVDLVARIERGCRLIRQNHRRFHRQHARQRDAAALAAGQFGDAAFAEFHDIGRLHRAQHRLRILRRQPRRIGRAMRIAAERHDIPRRQRPMHDDGPAADRRNAARARASDSDDSASPPTWIAPSDGTSPASARSSVVLPAPFGPTSATRWPGDSASETSLQHDAAGQRHVRRPAR